MGRAVGDSHRGPARLVNDPLRCRATRSIVFSVLFGVACEPPAAGQPVVRLSPTPIIGLAIESQCRFHKSFAYPDTIDGGLRVATLGRSSVRYEVGLFSTDPAEPRARAEGHFIHVFVERASQRPTPIPDTLRAALERLLVVPAKQAHPAD